MHPIESAYRTHGSLVFRRACQILGNESDAREIVQEIFTYWLEHPKAFGGRSQLTTWLYKVTTFRCLNRMRNHRRREIALKRQGSSEGPISQPRSNIAPDDQVILNELLSTLSEELAAVAIFSHVDRMTQSEIAEVLGCSRRKVSDLLSRVRKMIQMEVSRCPAAGV